MRRLWVSLANVDLNVITKLLMHKGCIVSQRFGVWLTEKEEKHIRNKKLARKLKNYDKIAAIQSNNKIITAVFDFQKVFSCPQGPNQCILLQKKIIIFENWLNYVQL